MFGTAAFAVAMLLALPAPKQGPDPEANGNDSGPAPSPRFERVYPMPALGGIMADQELYKQGIAAALCRANRVQGRILWIDCTANIDRYNKLEKIEALVAKIKESGFNTIVFDIKPISGQVNYLSKIAPKLLQWRTATLPAEFDALAPMLAAAKRADLSFLVSLNAFSEGHRLFMAGPGYDMPDQQTVLYEPQPVLVIGSKRIPVSPNLNAPLQAGMVQAYTQASKIPAPAEGNFAIAITKEGRIVDGYENGGVAGVLPQVSTGGCVLAASGEAAAQLRLATIPGSKAQLDVDPLFVPIRERPEQQYPLMMNPNDPRVRDRELAILREVVENYAVDGVIYDDRLRYGGLNADFSELSKRAFEKVVGKPLNWPDDVYKYCYSFNFTRGMTPGPYFQTWLDWRAQVLRDYVAEARRTVESIRPGTQLGVYAGSWFGEYSNLGSNYASPDFQAGFWYLTDSYRRAGFAPLLDFLITGCYYPTATIFDAMQNASGIGATVEYAGYLSSQAADDTTLAYAGIALSQFKGNPEGLEDALQAACANTSGVMVFDLSHDIEPMWPVFQRAFSQPMGAPHRDGRILSEVRKRREALVKAGVKKPPVTIATGLPGVGQ